MTITTTTATPSREVAADPSRRHAAAIKAAALRARLARERRAATPAEQRILDAAGDHLDDLVEVRGGNRPGEAAVPMSEYATRTGLSPDDVDRLKRRTREALAARDEHPAKARARAARNRSGAERRLANKELRRSASARPSTAELMAEVAEMDAETKRSPAPVVHVTREAPIYVPDGASRFFRDVFLASERRDFAAIQRLRRHEAADGGRTLRAQSNADNFGGAVVPSFLADEIARIPRAGKVLWRLADQGSTGGGLQVNIPRQTGGASSVSAQSAEFDTVGDSTYSVANLPVDVQTYAGRFNVSWQALDRSVYSDVEIFRAMVSDYDRQLEADAINGPGTGGRHLGVLNTGGTQSVTLTATTYAAFKHAVLAGSYRISQSTDGESLADAVVVHPRRWQFLLDVADANAHADLDSEPGADGSVGRVAGVPVYASGSIPTTVSANQDVALVVVRRHLFAADDGMNRFTYRQGANSTPVVGNGTLVGAGYSVWTAARRPEAVAVISGTGLVTPPTF